MCNNSEIKLLDQCSQPDLSMLIKAQNVIKFNMKRDWFELYEHYILEQKRRRQDEVIGKARKMKKDQQKRRVSCV